MDTIGSVRAHELDINDLAGINITHSLASSVGGKGKKELIISTIAICTLNTASSIYKVIVNKEIKYQGRYLKEAIKEYNKH